MQNAPKWEKGEESQLQRYDRVIMMLVDGMRYDFVKQMPFVRSVMERRWRENHRYESEKSSGQHVEALGFVTYAHPPTVTMPRLRAMMTGQMPNFIADIIENLQETAAETDDATTHSTEGDAEDSLLLQLRKKYPERAVHLFGDQTWFRLFGRHMFSAESQGTTSLFVKDTVEVDFNVTRDVFDSYAHLLHGEQPWSMLIMHYLGLDHVGHCGELHTPHMTNKLHEMDQVVERLVKELVANEKHRTLLVLCSDHGMTDGGNHGGASNQETDAFSLFITAGKENTLLPEHTSTSTLDDMYTLDREHLMFSHRHDVELVMRINQIDLAPSLSLLLGLPIPSQSMGKIIPHLFLSNASEDHHSALSMAMNINLSQLRNLSPMPPNGDNAPSFASLSWKSHSMTLALTSRDDIAINFAFISMGMTLLFSIASYIMFRYGISVNAKGMLVAFNMVLLLCYAAYRVICQEGWPLHMFDDGKPVGESVKDSPICDRPSNRIILPLWGSLSLAISTLILVAFGISKKWLLRSVSKRQNGPSNRWVVSVKWLCHITIFLLHPILLTSSSMIEEEHHLWYTASTSIALLVTADLASSVFSTPPETRAPFCTLLWPILLLLTGRIMRLYNVSGIRYATERHALPTSFSVEFTHLQFCGSVIAVMLYQVVQAIRSQGTSRSSKMILISNTVSFQLGMICVLVYKFGGPYVMGIASQNTFAKMAYFAFLANGLIPIMVQLIPRSLSCMELGYMRYTVTRIIYSLIGTLYLIHREEQALLVLVNSVHMLSISMTAHVQTKSVPRRGLFGSGDIGTQVLVFHVFGMASYYAFGRSISIAAIDFSGAYTGLDSFQPVIVGILGMLIHFGGPILYCFLAIRTILFNGQTVQQADGYDVLTLFGAMRSLTLLVSALILYIMREHLFIWSVFSPKWLYEIGWQMYFTLCGMVWLLFLSLSPRQTSPTSDIAREE